MVLTGRRYIAGLGVLLACSIVSIGVAAEDKEKDNHNRGGGHASAPAERSVAPRGNVSNPPPNMNAQHSAPSYSQPHNNATMRGANPGYAPKSAGAGNPYSQHGAPGGTNNGTPHTPINSTRSVQSNPGSGYAAHGAGNGATYRSGVPGGSKNAASTGAHNATTFAPRTNAVAPSRNVPNAASRTVPNSSVRTAPGTFAGSKAGAVHGPAGNPVYKAPGGNAVASRAGGNGAVLNHAASQSVVQQVNGARSGMKGINARPLPAGAVTTHANGNFTLKTAKAQYGVRANGSIASYSGRGQVANFRPNGSIRSVHSANMDIRRGPGGGRMIMARRPDHSMLVSTGRRSGYLERSVGFGGRSYIERDYVYGHSRFNRYYSPYHFGGLLLAAYVTSAYYAPAYYGWVGNPWAAPVSYRWGWTSAPWYSYYGPYFAPYPTYPSASYWLTDYAIAQTLESSYDEQQEGIADAGPEARIGVTYSDGPDEEDTLAATAPTPITPEIKAAIAQEVSRQLAEQQQGAASDAGAPVSQAGDLQNALQPKHVFVVSDSIDASTPDQQVCGLTAGDILEVVATPAPNDPTATLRVASSKRSDCPAGTQVQLSMQDLQDMHNAFRANIDAGLASLHDGQGSGGLPAAPAAAVAPPKQVVAPTDSNNADVQSLLDAQWQQADQTEAQIAQDVGAD